MPSGSPLSLSATLLRGAGQAMLAVLYPPHCLGCGASTAAQDGLCPRCWSGIRFIARPFCERLGTPFQQDLGTALLSPEAIAHPPAFGRARAVALFDDGPAQRLVHRLKYGDRHEVAGLLGAWMARVALELCDERPVLLPMPLHRTRLWRRQFNQAALLAAVMSRHLALPWDPELLARVKPTRHQVGMSRRQRQLNVQGAFRAAETGVRGRRILLVDDVLTTGATADAASRALLRAGAASVDLVVFARVAGRGSVAI